MRIHQLLVVFSGLILAVFIVFFVLSSDYIRAEEVQPLPNTAASDSIATIFYPNGDPFVAYPQVWVDIICRRTGIFCGETTDFLISEQAVEKYIEYRQYSSFQPWFLDPIKDSELAPKKLYVSSFGTDTADGSEDNPYNDIQQAIRASSPGTTIIVETGDYSNSEFLTISMKASLERPLRLVARGSDVFIPPVLIEDSQYIEISGFTIVGPEEIPEGWVDMPGVFIDNPAIQIDRFEAYETGRKEKIEKKYATWNRLLRWEKADGTSAGIKVNNSQYITLSNNEISSTAYGIELKNDSRRVLVTDNYLHHNLVGISGSISGESKYSFSESLIRNNKVEQSFRTGIAVHHGAHHNVIDANTVRYSGQSQLNTYRSAGNNMFIFNTAEYGGYYTEAMEYPGSSALSLHSCKKGCIAFGNYLTYQIDATGADGNGIILDFTDQGAYVASNIVYRTQGSGIAVTNSAESLILNNSLLEVGFDAVNQNTVAGIRTSNSERDKNNIVVNNLVYNSSGSGMFFKGGGLTEQKYIGYNLFSGEGAPLIVDDIPGKRLVINTLQELETIIGSEHRSLHSDAKFISSEEVKYKLAQYSSGYADANPNLMSPFNFLGERWKSNTIGAL